MKTTLLIFALAFLGWGHAHPLNGRLGTRLLRQREDAGGDKITLIDESVLSPTEAPEVIVYVDENGKATWTTTEVVVFVPPTATPQSVYAASKPSPDIFPPATPPPSVAGSPGSDPIFNTTATEPDANIADAAARQHGVAYSPYRGDGTCKSAAEVLTDFRGFAGDFSLVRLYGVDCNQVATGVAAARAIGVKLFLGIFTLTDLSGQLRTLVDAVSEGGGGWEIVDTVSVGNELVNDGRATVSQVVAAVGQVRAQLRKAGYTGPVVTVDTFVAVLNNPALCDWSDYCALNIHPFFDGWTAAAQAGAFITTQVANVRRGLADRNQRIVVTETGWPWQGLPNREAVPSLFNQQLAITGIRAAFAARPGDLILFTAYNDIWKRTEAATFDAEKWWGIGGAYAPSSGKGVGG